MIAVAAALVLAAASPAPARDGPAACPRSPLRLVEKPRPEWPPDARPTNGRVRVVVDLGSDGRVRRTATAESSGDAAVDGAIVTALAHARFAPPAFACMSPSFTVIHDTPIELESPAGADTAPPSPTAPTPCDAPFVRVLALPPPPHREAAGTASVDVGLDAAAHVVRVHLARSSGNKKSDYAAAVTARNGRYAFVTFPGCAAAPTTYRLEITYH